jgi:hypothetical protein
MSLRGARATKQSPPEKEFASLLSVARNDTGAYRNATVQEKTE